MIDDIRRQALALQGDMHTYYTEAGVPRLDKWRNANTQMLLLWILLVLLHIAGERGTLKLPAPSIKPVSSKTAKANT